MAPDEDPSAIRSIAVSPADVVDAFAYSRENPGEAVLRVTPPFHGRMRARLHVYRVDDTHLTGAVHLSPAALITDDVVDDYPVFEEAVQDGDSEDTDQLRRRHAEAVEAWQERAKGAIVDAASIETPAGSRRVDLKRLG